MAFRHILAPFLNLVSYDLHHGVGRVKESTEPTCHFNQTPVLLKDFQKNPFLTLYVFMENDLVPVLGQKRTKVSYFRFTLVSFSYVSTKEGHFSIETCHFQFMDPQVPMFQNRESPTAPACKVTGIPPPPPLQVNGANSLGRNRFLLWFPEFQILQVISLTLGSLPVLVHFFKIFVAVCRALVAGVHVHFVRYF